MALRYFSNSASVGTISNSLNNTDTTTVVVLSSGAPTSWPGQPCTAAISLGQSDEEVVLVTAISGTNVTLTRGYNGTAVRAHTSNCTLTHCSIALDFSEANTHVNATSGVHGVTGGIVGTADTQTLSNKTLVTPTIGDFTNADHDHSSVMHGANIPQSSVTGLATTFLTKADDVNTVHNTGAETVQGAKTFSAATTFTGTVALPAGVTATGATLAGATNFTGTLTGLAENTANVVPQLVDASNAVKAGVIMHYASANYSLSASAGTTVTYNFSSIPFTSILNVQLTANTPALNRIDTNIAAISNTSIDIRVRQSENSPVTVNGNVYVLIIGTV